MSFAHGLAELAAYAQHLHTRMADMRDVLATAAAASEIAESCRAAGEETQATAALSAAFACEPLPSTPVAALPAAIQRAFQRAEVTRVRKTITLKNLRRVTRELAVVKASLAAAQESARANAAIAADLREMVGRLNGDAKEGKPKEEEEEEDGVAQVAQDSSAEAETGAELGKRSERRAGVTRRGNRGGRGSRERRRLAGLGLPPDLPAARAPAAPSSARSQIALLLTARSAVRRCRRSGALTSL